MVLWRCNKYVTIFIIIVVLHSCCFDSRNMNGIDEVPCGNGGERIVASGGF